MHLTITSFKGLRVAGTLVLLGVAVGLGMLYWNSVTTRGQYLTSRNFRLLTVLVAQVQRSIDVQVRIVQNFVPAEPRSDGQPQRARSLAEAMQTIPTLRQAEVITPTPAGAFAAAPIGRYRMETESGRAWLRVAVFPEKTSPAALLDLRLRAAEILSPIFAPKLAQGAFDTLVLATNTGRVIYAIGRRGDEIQWTQLGTLLRRTPAAAAPAFTDLARTTSVDEVVIAGVNYKMFMQPCCGATLAGDGTPQADAATDTLIVAGLVESATLSSDARTISPLLVLVGIALVLLALVSWPFLKLALLGDRQRISVIDVVQLGTCAVLGLALATTVALTTVAHLRLTTDVDEQLQGLARQLDAHLTAELGQAYAQLACMERRLMDVEPVLIPDALREVPCTTRNGSGPPYPFFDTFALIGADGRQEVKAAPGRRVSAALSVADRQYFDAVQKGRAWRGIPVCPGGCFIESVRSWTTGEQRAVLSAPTGNPERPVAALSIPLRSVIDVVTPVGFVYAVIDENHTVLFHSDPERNGYENFVTETDRDRRLRAVVAARSAGTLNVNYWGKAHRAYVQPSVVPHWSIIALHDKEASRGLNVESTALTALFLVVYMTMWVAAVFAALRMGATWLWPDPARTRQYRVLACINLGLLALFGALAYRGGTMSLLWAGFAIPAAAWLLAPAILNWRRLARPADAWPRYPATEYTLMSALLLVVSGVVPAAAFVARAHDINLESYVKHRQLELARAVSARHTGAKCEHAPQRGAEWAAGIDEYFAFFYDTRLACSARQDDAAPSVAHHRGDALLAFLEDYMPYYGEYSVGMRELLHARAGDGSWTSRHTGDGRLELAMPVLTARSVVPTFRSGVVPGEFDQPPTADALHHERAIQFVPLFLLAVALGLGLLARAIVGFSLCHIFMSHVAEPLRNSRRLQRRPAHASCAPGVAADPPREPRRPALERLLEREGQPGAFLTRVCDHIRLSSAYRAGALTREQVLDELEERAGRYYRRLWEACSDDEKLVLGHVAQQGLANAASRRVVRGLLTRGVLLKDPALRLMNETFTRFVLSTACRAEVASLEGEAGPSTWDRLRAPLALGAASAGVFLFVTQREMFDSTLTTVAGVTAAVPTVFRLAALLTDRRPGGTQEAKA